MPAGTGVWVVKTALRATAFERLAEAVAALHPLARALQAEEGHVALVHVPDRGLDAERAQRAHAARRPSTISWHRRISRPRT